MTLPKRLQAVVRLLNYLHQILYSDWPIAMQCGITCNKSIKVMCLPCFVMVLKYFWKKLENFENGLKSLHKDTWEVITGKENISCSKTPFIFKFNVFYIYISRIVRVVSF